MLYDWDIMAEWLYYCQRTKTFEFRKKTFDILIYNYNIYHD